MSPSEPLRLASLPLRLKFPLASTVTILPANMVEAAREHLKIPRKPVPNQGKVQSPAKAHLPNRPQRNTALPSNSPSRAHSHRVNEKANLPFKCIGAPTWATTTTPFSYLNTLARRILPLLFCIHFFICGTIILVYNFKYHGSVPHRLITGLATTFAILIFLIIILNYAVWRRRKHAYLRHHQSPFHDPEKGFADNNGQAQERFTNGKGNPRNSASTASTLDETSRYARVMSWLWGAFWERWILFRRDTRVSRAPRVVSRRLWRAEQRGHWWWRVCKLRVGWWPRPCRFTGDLEQGPVHDDGGIVRGRKTRDRDWQERRMSRGASRHFEDSVRDIVSKEFLGMFGRESEVKEGITGKGKLPEIPVRRYTHQPTPPRGTRSRTQDKTTPPKTPKTPKQAKNRTQSSNFRFSPEERKLDEYLDKLKEKWFVQSYHDRSAWELKLMWEACGLDPRDAPGELSEYLGYGGQRMNGGEEEKEAVVENKDVVRVEVQESGPSLGSPRGGKGVRGTATGEAQTILLDTINLPDGYAGRSYVDRLRGPEGHGERTSKRDRKKVTKEASWATITTLEQDEGNSRIRFLETARHNVLPIPRQERRESSVPSEYEDEKEEEKSIKHPFHVRQRHSVKMKVSEWRRRETVIRKRGRTIKARIRASCLEFIRRIAEAKETLDAQARDLWRIENESEQLRRKGKGKENPGEKEKNLRKQKGKERSKEKERTQEGREDSVPQVDDVSPLKEHERRPSYTSLVSEMSAHDMGGMENPVYEMPAPADDRQTQRTPSRPQTSSTQGRRMQHCHSFVGAEKLKQATREQASQRAAQAYSPAIHPQPNPQRPQGSPPTSVHGNTLEFARGQFQQSLRSGEQQTPTRPRNEQYLYHKHSLGTLRTNEQPSQNSGHPPETGFLGPSSQSRSRRPLDRPGDATCAPPHRPNPTSLSRDRTSQFSIQSQVPSPLFAPNQGRGINIRRSENSSPLSAPNQGSAIPHSTRSREMLKESALTASSQAEVVMGKQNELNKYWEREEQKWLRAHGLPVKDRREVGNRSIGPEIPGENNARAIRRKRSEDHFRQDMVGEQKRASSLTVRNSSDDLHALGVAELDG